MGLPADNADGYRDGSPINFAAGLAGNLLIVHGTGDDNVHYQNAEAYRLGSPVTFAEHLRGDLLLVHGTGDDNVHPQNTIMLSRELIKAGKKFEQAIYPDEKHGFTDAGNRHFYERMESFFDRELRGR